MHSPERSRNTYSFSYRTRFHAWIATMTRVHKASWHPTTSNQRKNNFPPIILWMSLFQIIQPLNKQGRRAFSQGLALKREQGGQSEAEQHLTARAKFTPRFVRRKQSANVLLAVPALPIWSSQLTLNVLGEFRCPQLSACALMAQARHHFQWVHIKKHRCGPARSTMR